MHKKIASLAALGGALALALATGGARADPLTVTSYDMPNGNGSSVGGTYNYWDGHYHGDGNRHADGSFLSGGTGALTNGIVATQSWDQVSNRWGSGQYVGWFETSPTIDFHFGSTVSIDSLTLNVDNSHVGGVTAPSAVIVNGVTYANPSWELATGAQAITLTGLDIIGEDVSVTLVNPAYWVFLSEASFSSATPVPEPASGLLVLAGLGVLGVSLCRRRRIG